MNRNGSRPDCAPWPPPGADDTGAQLAVLAERVDQNARALATHDEQIGQQAGELGAIAKTLASIDGAVQTAKWLLPVFGGALVIVTGAVVAVVTHWR